MFALLAGCGWFYNARMSILRTRQLTRSYGTRVGVEGIGLQVAQGEIFGFLGPNGAGKSTTIRLLMGLIQPQAGSATVCDLDCWRESHRVKRHVGYLPGDLRLYPWMTGNNATRIVSGIRGMDITRRAVELADRFELEMKLPVRKMSRGTRQKLGLILAMAHRPQLLILDEPASGLDPLMQRTLIELLREAAADGQAVFFSSHTLSEVESLCHRVAIVRRGKIVVDSPLDALKAQAPRQIELTAASESDASRLNLPDCLQLERQEGQRLICSMKGRASQLIAWANQHSLLNISIGQPDLETLFHSHYHHEEVEA